jgi:hypothetical protein
MATQANQIGYGTNSPSALGDTNYWQTGDIVINNNSAANLLGGQNVYGWVCTAAGNPGTWVPMFLEGTQSQTTTATSGTLSNGYRYILLNPATTGTYTLPSASGNADGTAVTIKNIASGSTTLAPSAANNYADAAAITLAQYAVVTLMSKNGTTWYKVG